MIKQHKDTGGIQVLALARLQYVRLLKIVIGFQFLAWNASALSQVVWGSLLLKTDSAWYSSCEAEAIADSVIQYQSPQGGWPKNTDLTKPPHSLAEIPQPGQGLANSFDNQATSLPMQFLARVAHATREENYIDSFLRGVDYLLAAQYPHGGWPQFWPLRKGYYSHITYNDDAMIRVMTLLRDIAKGDAPYDFVDAERRKKVNTAIESGMKCILKTQIKQADKLTGWCAQHDANTLEPAWGRAYEPPSLSGGETVEIVRFLMSIEKPTDEIKASITGAVEWLLTVQMKAVRVEHVCNTGPNLVSDTHASPIWARFYELETNRPLYLDRDSVFRYNFNEIGLERRNGYSYHGSWAASLIKNDYPEWCKKYNLP